MQLSDYIDQEITVIIPVIDKTKLQSVRLRGVEPGGIWVESQTFMNHILGVLNASSSPRSLAFFFPYHAIVFGYVPIDVPGLNETAFGV
jgi:hypothetical protein